MTAVRRAALVTGREVALEMGSREATVTVLPFVTAMIILAGLGMGASPPVLAAAAPGLVWLVVIVAAVPLARGVAAAERTEDCWDLLRALVDPAALLAGKVAALWLWLLACWAAALLLATVLLGASWPASTAAGGLLGTLGVAVTTVVLGVLLPHDARRPGLLAVLLLPAAVPVLLAGAALGTAGVPAGPWLALLTAYDAVTLTSAWAMVPALLED